MPRRKTPKIRPKDPLLPAIGVQWEKNAEPDWPGEIPFLVFSRISGPCDSNSHGSDGRIGLARPPCFQVAGEASHEHWIVRNRNRNVIPMIRRSEVPSISQTGTGSDPKRAL